MPQPITGLFPADVCEATVVVRLPSIAATAVGRLVGRLCGCYPPGDRWHLTSKVLGLVAMPFGLLAYFLRLAPGVIRRYRLTNRRVVVQKGFAPCDERAIGLDEFDAIDVEVRPGYAFLRAGDLVFKRDGKEVFRLPAVTLPETYRAACLKVRSALLAVRDVMRAAAATATAPAEPATTQSSA